MPSVRVLHIGLLAEDLSINDPDILELCGRWVLQVVSATARFRPSSDIANARSREQLMSSAAWSCRSAFRWTNPDCLVGQPPPETPSRRWARCTC